MTSSLTPVGPVATLHLFDDLHADLVKLLRSLTPIDEPLELTRWINLLNEEFVSAMRRISPRILIDWVESAGMN